MEFFNDDHASLRLKGTVVRVGNSPIWIVNATRLNVKYFFLEDINTRTSTISCSELNLKPVPLGFVNDNNCCYYSYRVPVQRYKQGLSDENFKTFFRNKSLSSCLLWLDKTIKNIYPSIEEALTISRYIKSDGKKYPTCAFHRHFALNKDGFIFYKKTFIGRFIHEKEFILESDESCLNELLKEVVDANWEASKKE